MQPLYGNITGSAEQQQAAAVRRQKKKGIKRKARRAWAQEYGKYIQSHINNNKDAEQLFAVSHATGQ